MCFVVFNGVMLCGLRFVVDLMFSGLFCCFVCVFVTCGCLGMVGWSYD